MGWILFFSIGIPLLCLPAYILIEMTKPKEERWGRSQPNQAVKGSGSGSMKNPPIRPSAFVGLETTQHPADPRTLKPVQGLTEYVPIYSGAFLPAEHQLDLVTMDDEGNYEGISWSNINQNPAQNDKLVRDMATTEF